MKWLRVSWMLVQFVVYFVLTLDAIIAFWRKDYAQSAALVLFANLGNFSRGDK